MENELIVISAVWCPSCIILKKNLKKISEIHNVSFKFLDYDLDEEEVSKYNVGDKLPVIIYNNMKLIGEKSLDEIELFIRDCGLI